MKDKFTISDVHGLIRDSISNEEQAKHTEIIIDSLRADERQGVQKLIATYDARSKKIKETKNDFYQKLKNEQIVGGRFQTVAGIDEVGRGCLAGPVVACAIILPNDFSVYEVKDSKKLSKAKIKELYPKIISQAIAVGIGIVDNKVIDEINIYESARIAMKRAVEELTVRPNLLLVDAMNIDTQIKQSKIFHGDDLYPSISGASIVAKYIRDRIMKLYDLKYPGYDFSNNVGYGTRQHLSGLEMHGITPIHRKTFSPVRKYI